MFESCIGDKKEANRDANDEQKFDKEAAVVEFHGALFSRDHDDELEKVEEDKREADSGVRVLMIIMMGLMCGVWGLG